MTLEELRAWLSGSRIPANDPIANPDRSIARAPSSSPLRATQALQMQTRVIIQKFDKAEVTEPGIDGLEPIETVILDFDGERLRQETVARRDGQCHLP